jgi:hypothetical protein
MVGEPLRGNTLLVWLAARRFNHSAMMLNRDHRIRPFGSAPTKNGATPLHSPFGQLMVVWVGQPHSLALVLEETSHHVDVDVYFAPPALTTKAGQFRWCRRVWWGQATWDYQ